jgi:hypothetical protein
MFETQVTYLHATAAKIEIGDNPGLVPGNFHERLFSRFNGRSASD